MVVQHITNSNPRGGFRALHVAADANREDLIQMLVLAGADMEAPEVGYPGLFFSARRLPYLPSFNLKFMVSKYTIDSNIIPYGT